MSSLWKNWKKKNYTDQTGKIGNRLQLITTEINAEIAMYAIVYKCIIKHETAY